MSEESNSETQNEATHQTETELFPGYPSIEQFTKDGYKTLMEAIRFSNSLPNGRDWNFYNTHEAFKQIINSEGNNVQKLINTIFQKYQIEGNIRHRAIDEATELVVEANDAILERVASNIDDMNGVRKIASEPVLIQAVSAQLPVNGSWNRVNNATFSVTSSINAVTSNEKNNLKSISLLTAKNILRPQKFFKDKIINSSKYPWEPRITEKPNSLKPLAIFLEDTERGEEYSHPYEFELDKFTPLNEQLIAEKPIIPKPLEDTPLIEVSTEEQLTELLNDLQKCKVFSVDLEHHSYRSFMGITCLMQISTSEKDYIIDTLALRDKLYILNEVFTKPTILKVFHGADMDIQWLQRDLSIYVVNMFDTFRAAKLLEYSGLSLAYLLNRFCSMSTNKQFQLADWRIRPLPQELKSYAREDTHYLIYIYQNLKNELLAKANGQDNLLVSAFNQSTETCKKRYFKPCFTEDSYMDFYRKCKRMFDNRQLYALRELYRWRDDICREEDESTGYVLPNHMLLQISESLPREMQGILACCNPIPPLVRANLLNLHEIILRAREQPIEKLIMQEENRAKGATKKISKLNVDSPLNCPHDLSKCEYRDDLPTLLNSSTNTLMDLLNVDLDIENKTSVYSVFNNTLEDETDKCTKKSKLEKIKFLTPYERYKLVKPFIQAEEERLTKEKVELEQKSSNVGGVEERSDQDRIESIREHFIRLSKMTNVGKSEQSLIEMGGSRKRKREFSEERFIDEVPENDLHTPRPHLISRPDRKRKSSDHYDGENKLLKLDVSPQKVPSPKMRFYLKRKNNKRNKQKNFQKGPEEVQESHAGPSNQQNEQTHQGSRQRNKKKKNKNKHNHSSNRNSVGLNDSQNYESQQQQQGDQNNFRAFDYSSVDYRQFQGGAGGVQKPQQFRSNFKSRGRKRNAGRGFNKSQTFGGNTRGRGR